MLTPTGKFLRKLRIDRGEILKNMADYLKVSPAFLSAVENGKKKMPENWINTVCCIYQLTIEEKKIFIKAISETEKSITLELNGLTPYQKESAVVFAREFKELSDKELEEIRRIFEERK